MKREKFAIQFVSIETPVSLELPISKTEYTRQLAFLGEQIEKTKENEYPVELTTTVNENEKITITRHRFSVGTGDTYLTRYTCKPGYQFK